MKQKKHTQLLNFLLIMVGAILTIIGISSEEEEGFFKIVGIIFLMFGLYRATNEFIVSEEKRKNEDKEEDL